MTRNKGREDKKHNNNNNRGRIDGYRRKGDSGGSGGRRGTGGQYMHNRSYNRNNPSNFWQNRNQYKNAYHNHRHTDGQYGNRHNNSNYNWRDEINGRQFSDTVPNDNTQYNDDNSNQNPQNCYPEQMNKKLRFPQDNDQEGEHASVNDFPNEHQNNNETNKASVTAADQGQSVDKTDEVNFKKFKDNASKTRNQESTNTKFDSDTTQMKNVQSLPDPKETAANAEQINLKVVAVDVDISKVKQEGKKQRIDKESSSSSESEDEPAPKKIEKPAKNNTTADIKPNIKMKPNLKKNIAATKTTASESSSDDNSGVNKIKVEKKDKQNKRSSEDDLVCLGNLEKKFVVDDDDDDDDEDDDDDKEESDDDIEKNEAKSKAKGNNEAVAEKCLICDKKNHTSFQCQMICKNCSEPYHNLKTCPRPANLSIVAQSFMEFCMQQLNNFVPNQQYQMPTMLTSNYAAQLNATAPSSISSQMKRKHSQSKSSGRVTKKKLHKKKKSQASDSGSDDLSETAESSEESVNEDVVPMIMASKSAMKKSAKRKRKVTSTSASSSEQDSDDESAGEQQKKKNTTKKQRASTDKSKKLSTPMKSSNVASFAHTLPKNAYNPLFLNQMLQNAFSPHTTLGFNI